MAENFPYGAQVAREEDIVLRVIQKSAAARGITLLEGDLDGFCRRRREKIELHAGQDLDDDFERVRLLNMLYEGLLDFLKRGAHAASVGDKAASAEFCSRASKIVEHLDETLNPSAAPQIAENLKELYRFALCELAVIARDPAPMRLRKLAAVFEPVYSGFLEVEIGRDLEEYFADRAELTDEESLRA